MVLNESLFELDNLNEKYSFDYDDINKDNEEILKLKLFSEENIKFIKKAFCIDYSQYVSSDYSKFLEMSKNKLLIYYHQKMIIILNEIEYKRGSRKNKYLDYDVLISEINEIYEHNINQLENLKKGNRKINNLLDYIFEEKIKISNIHFFFKLLQFKINDIRELIKSWSKKLNVFDLFDHIEKTIIDFIEIIQVIVKPKSIIFIYAALTPYMNFKKLND